MSSRPSWLSMGLSACAAQQTDRHENDVSFLVCWQAAEKRENENAKLPRAPKTRKKWSSSAVWQTDSAYHGRWKLKSWNLKTRVQLVDVVRLQILHRCLWPERQRPWQPWLFYAIQELVPQLIPASGRSSWFEGRLRWGDLNAQLHSYTVLFEFSPIFSQHSMLLQVLQPYLGP